MGGFGGLGTVGVGVMQRWSANDGGAPLHHCAALTIASLRCPSCPALWSDVPPPLVPHTHPPGTCGGGSGRHLCR